MKEIKRMFLKCNPNCEGLWSSIETLSGGDPVFAVDRIQELAERDPSVSLPRDVLSKMFAIANPSD